MYSDITAGGVRVSIPLRYAKNFEKGRISAVESMFQFLLGTLKTLYACDSRA